MKKCFIIVCAIFLTHTATATQTCQDTILASTPDSQFTVNGDEVTDIETGLIWQRCSMGQTKSDCTGGSANTYTWQEALQAAENERTNTGQSWRLPNRNELNSIAEEKCFDPSINLTLFPNTPSSVYWSASPSAREPDGAWAVYFYGYGGGENVKSKALYVRLVRSEQ